MRVVVAGALANKPGNGGEAWVRLSWLEGLRRLGLDVSFVEELPVDVWGSSTASCIGWFRSVVDRFGLGDVATLLDAASGEVLHGPSPVAHADLLVNISGHLRSPALLDRCDRRAYVDIDPGYTQLWHLQGADLGLDDHDLHVTVGLNLGRSSCTIPTAGFEWHPVPPPVVCADWAAPPLPSLDRFTTVASWRGGFAPVEHDGVRFGVKAHQLRRLVALPQHVAVTLEVALDIHPADDADRRSLEDHGWCLRAPSEVAGDPDAFRAYVQASAGELSVAQGVYVETRSGWFSDRTARYLAAGRPALVQDTGFGSSVPTGLGLLTFTGIEDAAAGAEAIAAGYRDHAEAARALAVAHLDSTGVLTRFVELASP